MIEIKAPCDYSSHTDKFAVFLAGSIAMGRAPDWQKDVAAQLSELDILLLNPRREDWDSSWAQSADDPDLRIQVEWELAALDRADLILMYIHPETLAPISLLELGLYAGRAPEKLIVCCPEGYFRKGNVDIVCQKYGVRQVSALDALVMAAKEKAPGS